MNAKEIIEILEELADKMYREGQDNGRFTDGELMEELKPYTVLILAKSKEDAVNWSELEDKFFTEWSCDPEGGEDQAIVQIFNWFKAAFGKDES